ncbi:hypothetical protein A3A15_02985 [Candidatus Giovannonibacteria bacterium RIFCSPLOWO2_01_FULL_43_60]|nr:MAG: hypothetical protein A3A15_02985 [Candidatus Giovannonibacteria bacterium RIFCSPLOWO2_01_FULL_43_60]
MELPPENKPRDFLIGITETSAKNAIEELNSSLKIETIREQQEAMSNYVFFVNDKFAFRFARDCESGENLKREMDILPFLKEYLPVRVPDYIYRGVVPNTDVPFGGYEIINGTRFEPNPEAIPKTEKNLWGKNFGKFLSQLHTIDLTVPKKLGVLEIDLRARYPVWLADAREYIYPLATKKVPQRADELKRFIESSFQWYLSGDHFNYRPSLLHGDVEYQHIFWDTDSEDVSAVIDWGGVYIGDPDYDLWRVKQMWGEEFFDEAFSVMPETSQRGDLNEKLEFFYTGQLIKRMVRAINQNKPDREIDWRIGNLLENATRKK